jgi:hypothetical protein
MTAGETLVEVHLRQLPVAVWAGAQEHLDGLLREFTLIVGASREGTETHLPTRLLELVEELQHQYEGTGTDQDAQLAAAALAGVAELDLTYLVPASAAGASVRLGEMLDAADRYCQDGEHLLTLASPPGAIAFRRWFFDEFVRQIAGGPPCPWPRWVKASDQRPAVGRPPGR